MHTDLIVKTFVEEFRVKVEREEGSNRIVSVAYEDENGYAHRTFGEPAFELFNPASGAILERHYVEHNREHRIGGLPSYQEFDPVTGCVTFERWMENDLPRQDGISSIARTASGLVVQVVRREKGRQHIERYDVNKTEDLDDPSP